MAARVPLAFLSYAHFDDVYENGKLKEFAKRLSGEVQLQWGEEFPIFIDSEDVKPGQLWGERIYESLDGVRFLIPIVTPGYLKSDWCRKEFLHFLKRERQLQRNDLILPVYYVRCQWLADPAKWAGDEVAQVLAERQYQDWCNLRHEPWTTPEVGRRFEQIALQIVEALEQGAVAPPKAAKVAAGSEGPVCEIVVTSQTEPAKQKCQPVEPPTVVVDAMHRGNYTTISEAIRNSNAGTRILVRPGHYRDALLIDKPLEIVGEGNRDDIVVEASEKEVVLFTASMGRVANLTLRQSGKAFAVAITQGRLDLEDCDITSQGWAVVAIRGGADPRIRRNRIHDGTHGGLFLYENAAGLIEDNEVFGNTFAGIEIATGANPTVRRNRIHDGKADGIHVYDSGLGLIEENDIQSNAYSGLEVVNHGNPTARGNRITKNREGIRIHSNGGGTYERNVLSENQAGAWHVADDCLPRIQRSANTPEL